MKLHLVFVSLVSRAGFHILILLQEKGKQLLQLISSACKRRDIWWPSCSLCSFGSQFAAGLTYVSVVLQSMAKKGVSQKGAKIVGTGSNPSTGNASRQNQQDRTQNKAANSTSRNERQVVEDIMGETLTPESDPSQVCVMRPQPVTVMTILHAPDLISWLTALSHFTGACQGQGHACRRHRVQRLVGHALMSASVDCCERVVQALQVRSDQGSGAARECFENSSLPCLSHLTAICLMHLRAASMVPARPGK